MTNKWNATSQPLSDELLHWIASQLAEKENGLITIYINRSLVTNISYASFSDERATEREMK